MLTPENLKQRLREWCEKLPRNLPKESSRGTPILLYQNLYTLLHELKTSVSLSDSPQIHALATTVTNLEKDLKRLSYDEIELPASENASLLAFLQTSSDAGFDLQELQHLITGHLGRVEKKNDVVAAAAEKLLAQELPWDTLSKGRVKSAARHGYFFWYKNDECDLSTLLMQHDKLMLEIFESSGVPILRKLDNKATTTPPANGELAPMQLLYTQYAGFSATDAITRAVKALHWLPCP